MQFGTGLFRCCCLTGYMEMSISICIDRIITNVGWKQDGVAVLCRIESYSVTSSSPRSKGRRLSLNFRSSFLSPQGSQLHVHVYFSTVK